MTTRKRVRSPLLVTRCHGCYRRRACIFVAGIESGWKQPMCRQCLRVLMPRIAKALRAFKERPR